MLEQLSRRVLERRDTSDLHAAQWSALRYFSRSGERAANVAGLARYLGNTNGPASRTAKSLVERGLLTSTPARHDARSVVFSLTPDGHSALEKDPLHEIGVILEPLDEDKLAQLSECLDDIQRSLIDRRTP